MQNLFYRVKEGNVHASLVNWSGQVLYLGLLAPLSFCGHLPGLAKVYSLLMLAVLSVTTQSLNRYRRIPYTRTIWKNTE